jgi:DNA-binding NtrC family response regulator
MGMDSFRTLLVDDEEEFLATLMKRLRKRNMDVVGAGSGEAGLRILDQEPIDVVVLDVRMPGIDGIQTLRKIKKSFPLVEVVLLTGHANIEVAVEGMELGAFDYLMKPVEIDDLVYKLQDAYKKKNIQEQKIKNLERVKS